jgi:hypothetical protein
VIGILGAIMPAVSAQATPSTVITINSTVNLNASPVTGVWAATGAVTDSGTLAEPQLNFVGNGELQITRVVTGSQGTFTLRILSKVTGVQPDGSVIFAGQWSIIAGTGQYATLHGVGERAAIVNDQGFVTEALTGQAHFD